MQPSFTLRMYSRQYEVLENRLELIAAENKKFDLEATLETMVLADFWQRKQKRFDYLVRHRNKQKKLSLTLPRIADKALYLSFYFRCEGEEQQLIINEIEKLLVDAQTR